MNEGAVKSTIHGTFVVVNGKGVLILGDSGSGKSDRALSLISKGHKLVADDVVVLGIKGRKLIGEAPKRFIGLLNIRGIGVIDVIKLFGEDAYQAKAPIDSVVEIVKGGNPGGEHQIGSIETEIFGVLLQKFTFVDDSTRDLAVLIETATRLLDRPEALRTLVSL